MGAGLQYGVFENVALCPPEDRLELRFAAGLAFPEQYPGFARHKRSGEICDEACGSFSVSAKKLKGRYIYGGFVLNHYGHFIAESLGRLWVASKEAFKGLTVLFLISPKNQYMVPFIEDAMAYFKMPYLILAEDVVVEELVIAEEGKQMRTSAHPNYGVWLQHVATENNLVDAQFPKKICVLRGHLNAGKIAGEKQLEGILTRAGYFALRPENYSFSEQLQYYFNAEKIIFSEGSAIHMCDLLPALAADVAVINRRPLSILAETSFREKAKELHILPAACRVMSPRSKTNIGFNKALSYIPLHTIKTFLVQKGYTKEADWPKAWEKGVLSGEAQQYYMEFLYKGKMTEPDEADLVVSKLMEEVSFHFSKMRDLRYKLYLSKATEAMLIGAYDKAVDFAHRAMQQFPGKEDASELYAAAQKKQKQCKHFSGRFFDKTSRAAQTLWRR